MMAKLVKVEKKMLKISAEEYKRMLMQNKVSATILKEQDQEFEKTMKELGEEKFYSMPPLYPTFIVSPLFPTYYTMDPDRSGYNYYALLRCFGVHYSSSQARYRLREQFEQNKAVFMYNSIDTPAPNPGPNDFFRYCCAELQIRSSATTDNQYLLMFHTIGYGSSGSRAALYVNGNLIRSVQIVGAERSYRFWYHVHPRKHG
jgi:hypothetical protein